MSCIFCGRTPGSENGPHHILPKAVRHIMNWKGKRVHETLEQYKVPMCQECHGKVSRLQEPLVKVIRYLRAKPPIPMEFICIMDAVYKDLIGEEESE